MGKTAIGNFLKRVDAYHSQIVARAMRRTLVELGLGIYALPQDREVPCVFQKLALLAPVKGESSVEHGSVIDFNRTMDGS